MFLVNELTKNIDGYFLSYFLYKEKDSDGGLLHMGPLWDYNLAFGNADYRNAYATTGFQLDQNPAIWWWERFMEDPAFRENIWIRWEMARENALSDSRLGYLVDSLANLLEEAQVRNFTRWDILGEDIWPNYFIGETFEEEIGYLKSWILDRARWLDVNIASVSSPDAAFRPASLGAYPNPFKESLQIKLLLKEPAEICLEVFSLSGKRISTVVLPGRFPEGQHDFFWDAPDLSPSVYLLVLKIDGEIRSFKKVVKIRSGH
jgi:hypothetical protein